MSRSLTVAIERFPIAGDLHHRARARARRPRSSPRRSGTAPRPAAANACPMRVMARPSTGVAATIEHAERRDRRRADPGGFAGRPPRRRRPQRARLRALGPRRQTCRECAPHVTAGLSRWPPATTAYTISLAAPAAMAGAARAAAERPILKIKFGGTDGEDIARIEAVRRAAPDATLIADANEGWSEKCLADCFAACAAAGFALVEQPLPAADDGALARIRRPLPICADESVHDRAEPRAARRALRCRQHQARQDRRPHRGAGPCRCG